MSNPSKRKTGSERRFWRLSVLLHLLLILLLLLTPARELFFPEKEPPERPEITMRDERLEKLIEQIRLSEAEQLAMRVALLDAGAERMAQNYVTFERPFKRFEADRLVSETRDLRQSMEQTEAGLRELMVLFGRVQDLQKAEDEEALDEVSDQSERAEVRLINAMERVRRGIEILGLGETLVARQQELETDLFEISGLMRHFRDEDRAIKRSDRQRSSQEQEREEAIETLKEAEQRLAAAQERLATAEAAVEAADGSPPAPLQRELRGANQEQTRAQGAVATWTDRIQNREQQINDHRENRPKREERRVALADTVGERLVALLEAQTTLNLATLEALKARAETGGAGT